MRENQDLPEKESLGNEVIGRQMIPSLGVRLRALRQRFLDEGGQPLDREELMEEIAERRGGFSASYHEEDLR